jgi:hypothetical protein
MRSAGWCCHGCVPALRCLEVRMTRDHRQNWLVRFRGHTSNKLRINMWCNKPGSKEKPNRLKKRLKRLWWIRLYQHLTIECNVSWRSIKTDGLSPTRWGIGEFMIKCCIIFVHQQVTWADIYVALLTETLQIADPGCMDKFPKMVDFMKKVYADPNLRKYLGSRGQ